MGPAASGPAVPSTIWSRSRSRFSSFPSSDDATRSSPDDEPAAVRVADLCLRNAPRLLRVRALPGATAAPEPERQPRVATIHWSGDRVHDLSPALAGPCPRHRRAGAIERPLRAL